MPEPVAWPIVLPIEPNFTDRVRQLPLAALCLLGAERERVRPLVSSPFILPMGGEGADELTSQAWTGKVRQDKAGLISLSW